MALNAGDIVWHIGADLDNLDKALKKSKGKLKDIGTDFKSVGKGAGIAMTAAGAAGVAAFGSMAKASMDFGKAMAEVNTLGVQDLGAMSDAVKDVSARFGQDLTTSANAAYQAISAGASEAEAPRLLEEAAIAATAGVTDLTTAIELGTSVTNAFGMGIGEASTVFDQAFTAVKGGATTFDELSASVGKLSPILAAAGVGSGEMFASIAALTQGGIATSEAVTGMKAAISGIIKPTSEAQQMAESLGLQFDAAALSSQGLVGFLDSVKQATGGNLETMAQLFTSTEALNAVLALTGEQAGSFTALADEMANATGAAQEAFDRFADENPGFEFDKLKATISVLAVEIGDALAPVLSELAETIQPMILKVIEWVKNNKPLAKTLIIAGAAVSALMAVVGPLLLMLPGLATAFSVVSAIIPTVAAVITALTGPIGIIIALAAALAAAIVMNWDRIKSAVKVGVDAVTGFLKNLWTVARNAIGQLVSFMDSRFGRLSGIILGLLGPIGRVINALSELLGLSGQAGLAGGGVVGGGMAAGGVVKGYASGGVTGARIVEVGERGRELAALPVGTRVMSHPDMMKAVERGSSGGNTNNFNPTINVSVSGSGGDDPDAIVQAIKGPLFREMADEFRRAMR